MKKLYYKLNVSLFLLSLVSLNICSQPKAPESLSSGLCNPTDATTHFFANNPDLSWSEFEKNFRSQYHHLDVPTIDVTNLIQGSPAAYHSVMKKLGVNPEIIKQHSYSPEAIEALLLHEVGHHNFDQAKRNANNLRAHIALTTKPQFCIYAEQGLSVLQKSLMVANAYRIFRGKPNIKLLAAQYVATTAYNSMPALTQKIQYNRSRYEALRSEEIFADDFAAKHARKEALQAFNNECLSLPSALKAQQIAAQDNINKLNNLMVKANLHPINRRLANAIFSIFSRVDRALGTIQYSSSTIHDFNDPEHPSYKERFKMFEKAIKNRFGTN